MKNNVTVITAILFIIVAFFAGKCGGKRSAEIADRKEWEKERKIILKRADSIERAAQYMAQTAIAQRDASEEREKKAWIEISKVRYQDSIEDVKFKKDLTYYRSLIKRPAKEIQDLMMKEYEMATDSIAAH